MSFPFLLFIILSFFIFDDCNLNHMTMNREDYVSPEMIILPWVVPDCPLCSSEEDDDEGSIYDVDYDGGYKE